MFTQRFTRGRTTRFRKAGNGMAMLAEQGARAGHQLQEMSRKAARRSQFAWHGMTGYLGRHPLASVGVALAVGYAVRTFTRRRF